MSEHIVELHGTAKRNKTRRPIHADIQDGTHRPALEDTGESTALAQSFQSYLDEFQEQTAELIRGNRTT